MMKKLLALLLAIVMILSLAACGSKDKDDDDDDKKEKTSATSKDDKDDDKSSNTGKNNEDDDNDKTSNTGKDNNKENSNQTSSGKSDYDKVVALFADFLKAYEDLYEAFLAEDEDEAVAVAEDITEIQNEIFDVMGNGDFTDAEKSALEDKWDDTEAEINKILEKLEPYM